MAKKVAIFESYYEAARDLPPEEFKQFFTAIFERAFNENDIELDGVAKSMFTLVKPSLEKSLELSALRSDLGKLGGRPAKTKEKQTESKPKANGKQTESKPKADKDKDKDKDIEKEKEKKEKVASAPRFVKPTVAEVAEYCRERGNGINPESFVDFYESKGWKVGSNPMKDWKACVRTWEQRRKGEARAAPSAKGFGNMLENHYTSTEMSELERQLLDN
jgi:hypothetical protein